MTSSHHTRLVDNHLEFLATHRGSITHVEGASLVTSSAPGFTCAVLRAALPMDRLDTILSTFDSVRIVPGGESNEPQLVERGYEPAAAYVYMELPAEQSPPATLHPSLRIELVEDEGQRFWVGHVGEEPAGVTLLVFTAGVAGIYAVATRPAFRRTGVSTALLWHAVNEARARSLCVALQVMEGSYAERLYDGLGFRRAFVSRFFARTVSSSRAHGEGTSE
jgi:GNAT superfamily N-acetyltransferase